MKRLLAGALVACSSSPPAHHAQPGPAAPVTSPSVALDARPADAASHPDAALDAPACPARPLPKGCPAQEPNVNHPCSPKGVECTYAPGCCPIVYACNSTGHFEARFTRCN